MSDYGLGGPEWLWKLLGLLIIIGLVTIVVWTVLGVIWLFNHVQFV
jgi:hypothetical protein